MRADDLDAHLALATLLERAGKTEDAAKSYRRVLQSQPDNGVAQRGMGMTYKTLGRFREAVDPLKRAVKSNPQDAQLLYDLGECHFRTGNWDEANAMCRQLKLVNKPLADKLFDLINV